MPGPDCDCDLSPDPSRCCVMNGTTEMLPPKRQREQQAGTMAKGEKRRDWETGATISASTTRARTLDRCLFISVRNARKRLDRASWLVSCRLVSFSFLLDLGKLPKLDLGVLANDEHPGSSLCWTICATFEIHTVELEDNHSRSLHRTIIQHPHQPTSHFKPPLGASHSACSYDSRAFNQSQPSS